MSIPTPCLRTPTANSGTLSAMDVTPTGRAGRNRLIIWATPVKPPMEMLLGAKNQLKDRA